MAVAAPGQLNLDESPSWGSRSVDCFEKLEQIGEGTYGQVYMAKEIRTGEIVALKKIRMDNEREGFPITAIREIKILKKLHHENVIELKEIVTSPGPEKDEQGRPGGNKYKGSIYMVFEYMDHDLTGLSDRPGLRFTVPQIKCYMRQLLTGLHYCHVNQVLHRDIKGSNLLIDNEGNLKLADFGLARSFASDHNGNLTNRVITLWYRYIDLITDLQNSCLEPQNMVQLLICGPWAVFSQNFYMENQSCQERMRHSCCYKQKLRKGLWSPEEDEKLLKHITKYGHGCWSSVPKQAGLQRCGKSCRLRWINYLRPDL